jgi:hypothetical protein
MKTFLEKKALSRKNKSFIFILIRYFGTNIGNFDIFFKVSNFYLVNRMSPTKPRTRNTIILRHPVCMYEIIGNM